LLEHRKGGMVDPLEEVLIWEKRLEEYRETNGIHYGEGKCPLGAGTRGESGGPWTFKSYRTEGIPKVTWGAKSKNSVKRLWGFTVLYRC